MEDERYHLITGDVLEELRKLPEKSVHCVVTSPPYFALRSYLAKDDPLKAKEIGSEPTPDCGFRDFSKLQLRSDLTAEERQFVIAELFRLGVIR